MQITDVVIDGNGIRITWSNNRVDQLVWSLSGGKLVLSEISGVGVTQEYVDKVLDAIERDNISTQLYGYLTSSVGGLGDIPVSRALVPGSGAATLSTITVGGSGYLLDSLDYGSGADQSAYFQSSPGSSLNSLNISVLVTSSGNSGVASLGVGISRITAGGNLTNNVISTSIKRFTLESANKIYSHSFSFSNLGIESEDVVVLKIYRNGSSDLLDTSSDSLRLLKLNVS